MNNKTFTYTQIANSYALWTEFVDADGVMDEATFDATPVETLVQMMTDMFGADPNARITVELFKNNVWVTDAHLVRGQWQDGATLIPDEDGCPSDADDALYAQIAAAIMRGETDGRIETDDHVYAWQIA